MSGPLQCFCDEEFKKDKVNYLLKYKYKDPYTFKDAKDVDTTKPICEAY